MRVVVLSMMLTIIGSIVTVAWAAGFDPRSVSLEVWWNLGLMVGALMTIGFVRLKTREGP